MERKERDDIGVQIILLCVERKGEMRFVCVEEILCIKLVVCGEEGERLLVCKY